MAIYYTNKNSKMPTITNKGMVVKTGYESVRVMSDVWETWHYAIVYDVVNDKDTTIYCEKADVDATPELIALYKAHKVREQRHANAVSKWNEHNRMIESAHTLRLTLRDFKKLKRTYEGRMYDGCWDLLKVKKFRSTFRESLAIQLRNWLSEKENKYPFPFSRKQAEFVMPYSRW